MADQIGVAVIGASGGMGELRVRHFQEDPRSRVVAACARDMGRLREAVRNESIRLVADPGEVYAAEDVDAVVISTPNRFHYEQVTAALTAGKHVHCEYPLVDDLDRYDELTGLASEKGLVLHHGLTVRAEGHQLALKQALQGLGEPRAAYYRYYGGEKWYVDPAVRGDMFCGLHIHFMDQFVDLFGQPERVMAHGVEREGKVSAVVMMGWPSGLVGTIEFAMGFADKPGYMGTIVTTDGWCGFSMAEEPQITVERGGKSTVTTPPPDVSKELDARSFIDQILGTGEPLSDLATGRNAIALCLECSRQLATIGA
jgi:predicted dehydrogenase